jgi:DNA repair protein RecO (recombination protein O)
LESGYVLHRRRYRETSLIVEFLTEGQGRIAAVARGVLRKKSALASVLQPLVPLKLDVRGRSELLTLTHAEAAGAAAKISGVCLYSVLYINELIMKLTVVHDPLPTLHHIYQASLLQLAAGHAIEPILRAFERDFLDIIGLGMNLEQLVDTGTAIVAEHHYDYVADRGPTQASADRNGCRVSGATLQALAGNRDWADEQTREAKRLMRYVLNHHLDGRQLTTRELFAASRPRKS